MTVVKIEGKNLITKRGRPFLSFSSRCGVFIGAHLAELLKRETFNLYASLKRRNIAVQHADPMLLHLLISKDHVFANSTSVTLIRVDDVSEFVDDALVESERRKAKTNGGKRERDEGTEGQVSEEEGAVMLSCLKAKEKFPAM